MGQVIDFRSRERLRYEEALGEVASGSFDLVAYFCEVRDVHRADVVGTVIHSLLSEVEGAAQEGHESAQELLDGLLARLSRINEEDE